MGAADSDDDDDNESEDEETKLDIFNPSQPSSFVAFSKLRPKKIIDRIVFYLLDQDIEPELDKEQMKITFRMEQKLTEEEQELGLSAKECYAQVKLLKLKDNDTVTVITFKRLDGDVFFFNQSYNDIKEVIIA